MRFFSFKLYQRQWELGAFWASIPFLLVNHVEEKSCKENSEETRNAEEGIITRRSPKIRKMSKIELRYTIFLFFAGKSNFLKHKKLCEKARKARKLLNYSFFCVRLSQKI